MGMWLSCHLRAARRWGTADVMAADAIVSDTRRVLDAVGQLKSPTPRLGSPKVQGWLLGWIAGRAGLPSGDPAAALDEPVVHAATQQLFEGMSNPFGNMGISLGYTSLVEAQRIAKKAATDDVLDEREQTYMQWFSVGFEDAKDAPDTGAPARFAELFGR
jgi:hypothetical protein